MKYLEDGVESSVGGLSEGILQNGRVVLGQSTIESVGIRFRLALPSVPETVEVGVVEPESRV